MKISTTSKIAALVAASVLTLSSTAFAASDHGSNSENSCAVGNTRPMGANCTP